LLTNPRWFVEQECADEVIDKSSETEPVHGGDEFAAHGAGHAGNGNDRIVLHFGLDQAIKKPRTFSGGASVQIMRSFDYARTLPEAPEGFAVLVMRLVFVVMARELMGEAERRQRLSGRKSNSTRLDSMPLLRNKLTHDPAQSL
jgi:hypothetical protein